MVCICWLSDVEICCRNMVLVGLISVGVSV